MSDVIDYKPEVDISGGIKRYFERSNKAESNSDSLSEPMSTFLKLRKPLLEAAAKYKQKHGRPMVLVIDSVDVLAQKSPDFLGTIQDFAKNCADLGTLRIVFITSDGSALPLLVSRSAWSRAQKPAYEIGEIYACLV